MYTLMRNKSFVHSSS